METTVSLTEIQAKLDQDPWKRNYDEVTAVLELEEEIGQWLHCDHMLNRFFRNIHLHTPKRLREAIAMQQIMAELGESLLVRAYSYPACEFEIERRGDLSEAVTRLKASAISVKKFAEKLDAIIAGDTLPVDEFHRCMKSKC